MNVRTLFPMAIYWSQTWARLAAAAIAVNLSVACMAATSAADQAPNFAMLDLRARFFELHRSGARVVVIFFTENGCPIARQGLRKLRALRDQFPESDVAIWVVDANPSDDRDSIIKEAKDLGVLHEFPFLRDDTQGVARALGVTRTATALAISPADGSVFYRGAVDDQLSEGASKPAATENYLDNALRLFLAGKTVARASSTAHGCLINFDSKFKDAAISYSHDVAPILEKHCVACHSPGNIGPFTFANYQKVKSKSDMIEEAVLSRRMPPWSADPEEGHFKHERTMTMDETRTLLAWVRQGAPRGDGEDPLPQFKVDPMPDWPLGQPDFIVKLPHPEEVPAAGTLEYRRVKIDSPVAEDTWLGAVAIKPGNRKVLHHCIVRMQPKTGEESQAGRGEWLQGWAPGLQSERYPEGTGCQLKKGSVLELELHYTTMGSEQTDATEIGFYKLPGKPKLVCKMLGAYNLGFSIPPGSSEAETEAVVGIPHDTWLYAMGPHMHLRGAWMRYEALYPSGKQETLLSVPHYDFNWQTSYALQEPKLLPAGTWILCTGGFDNSAQNPNNPAPQSRVGWGDQSFNEMFIGFLETAEVPKNAEGVSTGTTAQN